MRSAVFACIVMAYPLMCGAIAQAAGPGYVIITTTNIVQQSTELTNFVAHKEDLGFEVQVVSNTAAGWNGGTADAAAENIRDWLKGNYTNAAAEIVIDYALLVGDPNPASGDVPMKLCYPRSTNEACPTDFYYADLTGNWDINGNEHYGEYADYTNACGADRHYEVAVGRVPYYGSTADLDGIFRKTIDYEASALTNADWRANALLLMPYQRWDTLGCLAGQLTESRVLDPERWARTALYDSLFSEAETLDAWTNAAFGLVMSWGHGNEYAPIGTESWGESGWPIPVYERYLSLDVVGELDDAVPAHVFLCGCLQAHPETTNNLAYSLLCHGAISAVGATRRSFSINNLEIDESIWFAHGVNPRIMHDHVERLVRELMAAGDALYDLKHDHPPYADHYPKNHWMNYLDYNLYGCPAVGVFSHFTGALFAF